VPTGVLSFIEKLVPLMFAGNADDVVFHLLS